MSCSFTTLTAGLLLPMAICPAWCQLCLEASYRQIWSLSWRTSTSLARSPPDMELGSLSRNTFLLYIYPACRQCCPVSRPSVCRRWGGAGCPPDERLSVHKYDHGAAAADLLPSPVLVHLRSLQNSARPGRVTTSHNQDLDSRFNCHIYCRYTVGVNKNWTLVLVNFSAQDASILKISVTHLQEDLLRIPKHPQLAKLGLRN